MKTISVDIALRKSGLVILDGREIKHKDTLKVNSKLDRTDSLVHIYSTYEKIFSEVLEKDSEVLVCMEDVMTFGHLKAAVAIETARTSATLAYRHVCGRMGVRPRILYATPSEVKHHFTGKRGAKKPELFEKFLRSHPEYSNETLTEDEMDALVLAVYCIEKRLT